MAKQINVIDLFAGPGGLGEGFSAYKHNTSYPYQIKVSIEKEASAHKTLTLRSFVRKFRGQKIPAEYYEYLRDPELGTEYLAEKYPRQWSQAVSETMIKPRELGTEDDLQIFKELRRIKRESTNPFVVIGGPPCQAYSVMGRIKNRSIEGYKAEEDHRHYLYREYLKVLDVINPEVFVMENVRGIITSKLNGKRVFPDILNDLRCPAKALEKQRGKKYIIYSLSTEPSSYSKDGQPTYTSDQDYVIKSEKFGIPQNRHRIILLGIREDIAIHNMPGVLKPETPVTTDQMIDCMPKLRSAVSRKQDSKELWRDTVISEGNNLVNILRKDKKHDLAKHIQNILCNLRIPQKQTGDKRFIAAKNNEIKLAPNKLKKFIEDKRIKGYLNHFARSHMPSDLQRYLFCAAFSEMHKSWTIPSPKKNDFPEELAPNHKSWETGKFADRFRVQFRGRFSSTITSHISQDGHFYIHYDPSQCRSLSVREAARLQTFPDNYFFEGNQTQQYVQVGNAVPPYLAHQIAKVVFKLFS